MNVSDMVTNNTMLDNIKRIVEDNYRNKPFTKTEVMFSAITLYGKLHGTTIGRFYEVFFLYVLPDNYIKAYDRYVEINFGFSADISERIRKMYNYLTTM